MKALGWLAILLLSASTASAQVDALSAGRPWPSPPQRPTARPLPTAQPNPAVVRVVSPEKNGLSLGSGTLVAITGDPGVEKGLILTNWHVVRDAAGQVSVVFPDGVRKPGRVLKLDPDWDLAAIEIDRPHVAPIAVADTMPQKGDRLTIAGYGPGAYRSVAGRCTQFLSPGGGLPFQIIELSAEARQGDSGGPILNDRGELAGVLFGAAKGTTSGSHCGRVQMFLNELHAQPPEDMHGAEEMLALAEPPRASSGRWVAARRNKLPERSKRPERLPPVDEALESPAAEPAHEELSEVGLAALPGVHPASQPRSDDTDGWLPAGEIDRAADYDRAPIDANPALSDVAPRRGDYRRDDAREDSRAHASQPDAEPQAVAVTDYDRPPLAAMTATRRGPDDDRENSAAVDDVLTWHELAGLTPAEQLKSVLAAIGIVGLFLHGFRCLRIV